MNASVETARLTAVPRKGIASLARRLIAEPLLQFVALGAAIFVVAHAIEHHRASADRRILVDEALTRRLVNLYELQLGTAPTPTVLNRLIDDYVHDEILYREAIKLGLDQNDEIVRRRLIQKLDFVNRDLAQIAEPTDAQLRDYYDAHLADFTESARVTFSHVYFSPDKGGSQAARQRAQAALASLQGDAAPQRAPERGDRFPLQYDYAQLDHSELTQVFGHTAIVDALLAAPVGSWSGPYESGYGWHLVRVDAARPETRIPFLQAREGVREAWLQQAREDANRKHYAELRAGYDIVDARTRAAP